MQQSLHEKGKRVLKKRRKTRSGGTETNVELLSHQTRGRALEDSFRRLFGCALRERETKEGGKHRTAAHAGKGGNIYPTPIYSWTKEAKRGKANHSVFRERSSELRLPMRQQDQRKGGKKKRRNSAPHLQRNPCKKGEKEKNTRTIFIPKSRRRSYNGKRRQMGDRAQNNRH